MTRHSHFVLPREPWTPEDDKLLTELVTLPHFTALRKKLTNRIQDRNEEILNAETTDELIAIIHCLKELRDFQAELELPLHPRADPVDD